MCVCGHSSLKEREWQRETDKGREPKKARETDRGMGRGKPLPLNFVKLAIV